VRRLHATEYASSAIWPICTGRLYLNIRFQSCETVTAFWINRTMYFLHAVDVLFASANREKFVTILFCDV
jgi:hypothetical protein